MSLSYVATSKAAQIAKQIVKEEGGTTYTAGNGIAINGTEISIDTQVTATKTDVAEKSKVTVATTGTSTTEAKYITVDNNEYKLASGGMEPQILRCKVVASYTSSHFNVATLFLDTYTDAQLLTFFENYKKGQKFLLKDPTTEEQTPGTDVGVGFEVYEVTGMVYYQDDPSTTSDPHTYIYITFPVYNIQNYTDSQTMGIVGKAAITSGQN